MFRMVVRGWELEPVEFELACRASTTARTPRRRSPSLELAGVDRAAAEQALASFAGVGRRFELVGERGGVRVIDDYGHNPTEIAATLRTARELEPRALIAVYQPHVYERTRQLHHELGDGARARRRRGRDRRDRRARRAASRASPASSSSTTFPRAYAADGRRRSTTPLRSRSRGRGRATSSSRSASASRGGSRARSSKGFRAVTDDRARRPAREADDDRRRRARRVRSRGRARVAELGEALRFARDEGLDVLAVGLGSNLLAADEGVDALVLRLEGELAAVEVRRRPSRRGWWRDERGLPASGARRRPGWVRVRMRDPRNRRRRRRA